MHWGESEKEKKNNNNNCYVCQDWVVVVVYTFASDW